MSDGKKEKKIFIMPHLYEKMKYQQGFTTRPTAAFAMNHLNDCEMSAEWPFAGGWSWPCEAPLVAFQRAPWIDWELEGGGTEGNQAMPAPWWAFQLLLWYHISAHYFFHCKVVYSNFSGSLLCELGVCVCVCVCVRKNRNYCLYSSTTRWFKYRNMLSKCYQTQIFIHIWNADRECSCLHA